MICIASEKLGQNEFDKTHYWRIKNQVLRISY